MTAPMLDTLRAIASSVEVCPGLVVTVTLVDERPWYQRWLRPLGPRQAEFLVVDPDDPRTWLES